MLLLTEVRSILWSLRVQLLKNRSNLFGSPKFCVHVMALYVLVVVYRDHARDPSRPLWLKVKGARPISDQVLKLVGLRKDWVEYLNVMLSMDNVDMKRVQRERPVPNKRGPKPKNVQ